MRTRTVLAGGAVALAVAGAGGAYAVYKLELLSGVEVESADITTINEAAEPPPKPRRRPRASWMNFRYDERRTGFNPGARARLPFKLRWKKGAFGFLEAPPAVDRGILVSVAYGKEKGSNVIGVNARTGKLLWRKHFRHGTNFAGGPAIHAGRVYVPAHDGWMRVFGLRKGRLIWKFRARPNEGPPVISRNTLYFGDGYGGVGEMYAINVRTRKLKWKFRAGNHISSGAALTRSTLYFASYDGSVYALNRANGKLRWRARVQGPRGNSVPFYGTPAVAWGLVLIGGLDGGVYALDARTGAQRWRFDGSVGNYSSPAVYRRTIYIGDYGGGFYALNVRNGQARWSKRPGPIIGSAVVVRGVVFVSTLKPERTWGYDAHSGKLLWTFPDGEYGPFIADRNDLWLAGKMRLYRFTGARRARRPLPRPRSPFGVMPAGRAG